MTATLAGTPTEAPPAPFDSAYYTYDGDDNMVMSVINGVTTYYPSSSYVVEVDGSDTTVRKTYSAGNTSLAVRTIVNSTENTLNWMLSDHLGSSSITTAVDGTWNSEIRYSAFGETRYSSGITPTDYRYTGQLEQTDVNLYYYNARYYDAALGRFVQSDISVPEARRTTAYDRYAYVENNPLLFVDLNGLEKVIIFYGTYEDDENSNSFKAAASTQYQKALDAGYNEDDILMVKISTDEEFFDAIENSKTNEIEQIHIFAHGWDVDSDSTIAGGIQIGQHDIDKNQITATDFSNIDVQKLGNRFSNNSSININACRVGGGTLPQTMANTFDSSVYAYTQPLKFFQTVIGPVSSYSIPYIGKSNFEQKIIEMSPYFGGVGRKLGEYFDISVPLPITPVKFTPSRSISRSLAFRYSRVK